MLRELGKGCAVVLIETGLGSAGFPPAFLIISGVVLFAVLHYWPHIWPKRLETPVLFAIIAGCFGFALFASVAFFWPRPSTGSSTPREASLTSSSPTLPPPSVSATAAPPHRQVPPDPKEALFGGWTLHKRGDHWALYLIADRSTLDAVTAAALDQTDMIPDDVQSIQATALWSEVRTRVPQPKFVENALGVVPGQQLIEHLNRRDGDLFLNWNYELMRDGSGITPRDAPHIPVQIASLSPESQHAIDAFDDVSRKAVNRRYIDALITVQKAKQITP